MPGLFRLKLALSIVLSALAPSLSPGGLRYLGEISGLELPPGKHTSVWFDRTHL